jgi:outer membrane murein-binding lipoprotein Lpp
MPIATKLSRRFQEVFGTEAADAMVDWMHEMEGGRAELRDLNDLSFARFDSRLGERIAQLELKLDRRSATLDAKIDHVAAELDAKIDRVAGELNAKIDHVADELNAKIDQVAVELNAKIDRVGGELNAKIDHVAAELSAKIDHMAADLGARMEIGLVRGDASIAHNRAELMRWAAAFWIGSLVAMAGTMVAVVRLTR